nr:MAG TPA: hypothetical protein [Inoviridae sp.]
MEDFHLTFNIFFCIYWFSKVYVVTTKHCCNPCLALHVY